MKNYIAGLAIFLVLSGIGKTVTGHFNRSASMQAVGAGQFARSFSKICHREMDRNYLRFRYGAPTVANGCLCIGVRLERKYSALSDRDADHAKRAITAYTRHLRRAVFKSQPARADGEGIIDPDLVRDVKKAFHQCDNYDLNGNRVVDMTRFPAHLKKRYSSYYRGPGS